MLPKEKETMINQIHKQKPELESYCSQMAKCKK